MTLTEAPAIHHCRPGWKLVYQEMSPFFPAGYYLVQAASRPNPGSIWPCECGKTFVAYYESAGDRIGAYLGVCWRSERARERRSRIRWEAKVANRIPNTSHNERTDV
jgi:hypothetical protein